MNDEKETKVQAFIQIAGMFQSAQQFRRRQAHYLNVGLWSGLAMFSYYLFQTEVTLGLFSKIVGVIGGLFLFFAYYRYQQEIYKKNVIDMTHWGKYIREAEVALGIQTPIIEPDEYKRRNESKQFYSHATHGPYLVVTAVFIVLMYGAVWLKQ